MQALVWNGPQRLDLQEIPQPEPDAGEVLIEVSCAGISGVDVDAFAGRDTARQPPLILGHEAVGRVAAVGEAVSTVALGDRIVLNPMPRCGSCPNCRRSADQRCLTFGRPGFDRPGAFAERMVVPEEACFPVPVAVADLPATLASPLAQVLGLTGQGDALGRFFLVVGLDTPGLLALQVLLAAGAEQVLVADDRDERLATAAELGASHTIHVRREQPAEVVKTVGRPLDGIIVASEFVQLGLPGGIVPTTVAGGPTRPDMEAALRWLGGQRIDFDGWTTMRPLAAGPDSCLLLQKGVEPVARVTLAPAAR